MLTEFYDRLHKNIVQLVFLDPTNKVIGAGSGFISNGLLITNNHVYMKYIDSRLWIRTHDSPTKPTSEELIFENYQVESYFKTGSDKNNYDYAVLEIPEIETITRSNLKFSKEIDTKIGERVALFGFPLDHMNLTMHTGTVSGLYNSNGVDIIQIDASVNNGNSGGPLINIETNEIIGIVTRKGTGLDRIFDQLKKSVDSYIDQIKHSQKSGMRMEIVGIDPVNAFLATQQQILITIQEIERSANVGIGYAFSIHALSNDLIL